MRLGRALLVAVLGLGAAHGYGQTIAFDDQKAFWRTVSTLQYDERHEEDVNTKQEDHVYDEVRYACMARPIIPKKVSKVPPGSFQAERMKLIKAKRRAKARGTSVAHEYRG